MSALAFFVILVINTAQIHYRFKARAPITAEIAYYTDDRPPATSA